MNNIDANSEKKNKTKSNNFSKDSIKEIEKKKLQDFYSSFLGSNSEEVKANSRILRRKIYLFGFFILIIALFFYFFVAGKISFIST